MSQNLADYNINLLKTNRMNKKVRLSEIKVLSFITNLEKDAQLQLRGGQKSNIPTMERCFTGNDPTLNSPCK